MTAIARRSSAPCTVSILCTVFTLLAVFTLGTVLTPLAAAVPEPPSPGAQPLKHLVVPGEAFTIGGRTAFVFAAAPGAGGPAASRPWILYGPTLPAYPDEAEKWMHEQFVAAGVAVAGIDAGESYGSPEGVRAMEALHAEMVRRGYARKPALLGRSRGGLWAGSWAIAHPELAAGIGGIYPVYDWRTYPGVEQAAAAYGLPADELGRRAGEFCPIERIQVAAEAGIPVCIIHGDDDRVVPLEPNSAELEKRYAAAGRRDLVRLIIAHGQGHSFWEGYFHCQELVDFLIARARAGAEAD
jgi:pimeloyl-ACP methyl ester carboxylesterase